MHPLAIAPLPEIHSSHIAARIAALFALLNLRTTFPASSSRVSEHLHTTLGESDVEDDARSRTVSPFHSIPRTSIHCTDDQRRRFVAMEDFRNEDLAVFPAQGRWK
ncbi:hypothetical protein [Bradyrhizobium sp. Ce-3]|uniref:hypothetical protein n=1 Tax=Bradyrhizobium sp. Ce-3 TaxID=2913970 RepID=UPI001FC8B315|nr:hypothetical protein [Bradyrhizobium sp. Ce-3]